MSKSEITIDVSYKCNLDCPFCSTASCLTPLQMPNNVAEGCRHFMRLVKKSKNGNLAIVISGGEPLLFDKLGAFLKLWNSKADEMILCSTGSIDKGQYYWNELYSYGLKTVRLSLHGISQIAYKEVFGSAYSFTIVENTMGHIVKAGIALELNYVLSKLSINYLESVFDYSVGKSIHKIRVLGLSRQGRAKVNWKALSISEECEKNAVAQARKMSLTHKINVEFAGLSEAEWCSHSDAEGNCLGGESFFHITTNGDIYPCPGVKALKFHKIGSVLQLSQIQFSNVSRCRQVKCLIPNNQVSCV